MEVFIVFETYPYERDEFIGVYSSFEKAEKVYLELPEYRYISQRTLE